MNMFVGSLPREATQEMLQEAFSAFGQVASVTIVKDKMTGEPRGFGFVEMPSQKEAEAAMTGVREIGGRQVTINEARPKNSGSGFRGGTRGFRGRSW